MNPTEEMTAKKPKTTPASQLPSSARVMDIAKPGTLKNATSRPVIVTNRVVIQDPMVNATGDKSAKPAGSDEGLQPEKIVIKPLSDPDTDTKQADKEEIKLATKEGLLDIPFDNDSDGVVEAGEIQQQQTLSDPSPATAKSEAKPTQPDDEPDAKADTRDKGNDDDTDDTDSKPSSDKADLDKVTAEEEAAVRAQEEFEEVIADKTYFLPINAAQHRRSRIVVIFGVILILVLALAWINVALDAGIITIPGVKSLTHFFGS